MNKSEAMLQLADLLKTVDVKDFTQRDRTDAKRFITIILDGMGFSELDGLSMINKSDIYSMSFTHLQAQQRVTYFADNASMTLLQKDWLGLDMSTATVITEFLEDYETVNVHDFLKNLNAKPETN